ncbi:MAG: amidohydrolase family protein [Proteobacteria bacterium]|nr:amidohydrolase family protein [Pseudomonadota bacterium]
MSPAFAGTPVIIHAGHLVSEPGKPPTHHQSIVVVDGKITAIQDGFVPGEQVIDLKDAWVIPGLIDMHTHVTDVLDLERPIEGTFVHAYTGRPAAIALAMLPRLQQLLLSGITTIRNLGDPSSTTYDVRDAIRAGAVVGPRMVAIEPQIAVDGGDYDASRWGVRADLERYVANRGNCTGAVQCAKVVREEVQRGADVIKFRQAGAPFLNPRIKMVESIEEIHAVIDTAHQLDRRVAVHVVGSPEFLHAAIEAGADSIEHGPLDARAIELMKQRGTAFTPTLLAVKLVAPDLLPAASRSLLAAYRGGVRIVYGTDLGIFGPERIHEEFALMAAAGLPPEQVLRAATVNAAIALGKAESLGSLAAGKTADLVALKVDPLSRIDALGDPAQVVFVMKDGRVYRAGP